MSKFIFAFITEDFGRIDKRSRHAHVKVNVVLALEG